MQQIFGGQNFNLGNVLPATLSSAAAILSYLGTDSAFNKAGNLVNNAETAAGNQVNNAATAAGQLQWGRDQLIAETPASRSAWPPSAGFNGAAIN